MKIEGGLTRYVIVPKHFNFVIKVPALHKVEQYPSRWWCFYLGLLSNLTERLHGYYKDSRRGQREHLAKVYFTDWLGLCLIMEKVEVLNYEYCSDEYYKFMEDIEDKFKGKTLLTDDCKPNNWGLDKNGKLVKIDYGRY